MSRALPSLNALRAFEAAARLQSVSLAAAELHVTHGAISRQVKLLERELGQTLFIRHGRGLALTAAGLQLRDATGTAFSQLQQAVAQLRPRNNTSALVLGCPSSLLARWLIPRLAQLQSDLPKLRLHLLALEGDLQAPRDDLDAALFLSQPLLNQPPPSQSSLDPPPHPAGWQVHELAIENIGPVLAPALVDRWQLDTSSPHALLPHQLLHTTSRPQAWPSWARSAGLNPLALKMGDGFPHLYHLLEAASAGLGIAIAPQQLVQDELDSGRLLAPWGFVQTQGRWLLAVPVGRDSQRVSALADWLRDSLATRSSSPDSYRQRR